MSNFYKIALVLAGIISQELKEWTFLWYLRREEFCFLFGKYLGDIKME